MTKQSNSNLSAARNNKNDEFYTSYTDVENELTHYKDHFENKIIYCNCDDPTWSQFYFYLKNAFSHFKLSKLITTHYVAGGTSYKREYDGVSEIDTLLTGDGDFRSDECKTILDTADIVITNPPFSLFREFISLLVEKQKHFLIIGSNNAISYKDCFKLIKENKMWLGVNSVKNFTQPDNTIKSFGNIGWFTNLTHAKRNQPLDLYKNYSPQEYPRYDNYDAIEVSKVKNIPQDYIGIMGVPITFLDKYSPAQFEIVNANNFIINNQAPIKPHGLIKDKDGSIAGKPVYARLLIKHKNPVIVQEDV